MLNFLRRLTSAVSVMAMVLTSVPATPARADGVVCLPNAKAKCPKGKTCAVQGQGACKAKAKPKPKPKPQPKAQPKPKPKPKADGTKPKPKADGGKPKPKADGTKPKPKADGGKPKPKADGGKPKPKADGTKPKPKADGTKPKPKADGTKPKPKADGTKPKPKADGGKTKVPGQDKSMPKPKPQPKPKKGQDSLDQVLGARDGKGNRPKPPDGKNQPRPDAAGDGKPDAGQGRGGLVRRLNDGDVRRAGQDFDEPVWSDGKRKKGGLSDLEKFGLVILGGLVVGAILKNGNRVVSNNGDRVVVQRPDGSYEVLKDDDAVLRRPGSEIETQSFDDGSTRTIVTYPDGTKIVTIRDAAGRVLRRARVMPDGRQVLLLDDTMPEPEIDVARLPKPRQGRVIGGRQDLEAALAELQAERDAGALGASYSLAQIRDIPRLRRLAPRMDVDNIVFASGSAALAPTQAEKLDTLGRLMADMVAANPSEMFLIEGHTDAVGDAGYNLTLSDRRAESLALALTEYYGIPPENMVVQGYGEGELRVETQADERRNRRAVVRVITPLLRQAAAE